MRRGAWPLQVSALAFSLVLTTATAAEPSADLSEYFGEFSGCALLETRDRYRETRLEYGAGQCRLPLSPCSTFKIPNALIGLQTGVVIGPGHEKAWDGVIRDRPITNQGHTLASAIEHSVVWYFQDLAREVGEKRMQDWLDQLGYGNRDLSGGIDRFWLGSSLEIDAYSQLEFVEALWRDGLPFDSHHQQQVRDMLQQNSPLAGELHGKTGSCLGNPEAGSQDHGWFIGWVNWEKNVGRNPATTWFVANIVGEDARGFKAREIVLQILETQQP